MPTQRKGLRKHTRRRILARDGLVCRYCGRRFLKETHYLSVDHVNPVRRGGADEDSNFVVACKRCNSSKCDLPLEVWLGTRFPRLYGLSPRAQHVLAAARQPAARFSPEHHTMNKIEAAKYLQIGVRSLERYTSDGRLQPGRVRTKTGLALDYTEAELERFKAELEADAAQVLAGPPSPAEDSPEGAAMLARVEPQVLAASKRGGAETGVMVPLEVLARLAATLGEAEKKPRVATAEKLLLDLAECQSLTGLSRGHLRAAIESGELQAKRIGRGFKVRREELERWVRESC